MILSPRRLREHQKVAFRYAIAESHPVLFLEMRLGKTLVAIRRILMYKPLDSQTGLRVLIVAPSSALDSWQNELDLENQEDHILLMGTKKKRGELLDEGHRWNLLNKEGHLALPEVTEIKWDAVILDESIFIKNPRTKVTKFFLKHFRGVPHRWILTGTPNPESDLEFWCQLAFEDGYAFGFKDYWHFRMKCFKEAPEKDWFARPGIPSAIRKEVGRRACVIRRKDVDMDVEKIYEKRIVTFPKMLEKSYKQVEDEFILSFEDEEKGRTKYSVSTYTWLRQMCGGFIDGECVWEGKIKELISLLKGELKREQVVVWFFYNQEMFACHDSLRKKHISCGIFHKDLKQEERTKLKKEFAKGRIRVILIQQALVQMGADLSAADTEIYYSSPPGLLARMQTEDRIIELEKQGVLVIDLLVEDSVDIDLYRALRDKKMRSTLTMDRARKYCLERRNKR